MNDDGVEGKKAKASETNEPEKQTNDWSILDNMISQFINTPKDEMLSVLCGYFFKIISSILVKENQKFLEYLLLRREGAIFNGLMRHINHHSLSQLVLELLQIQIKPEDKKQKLQMYNSDGSDQEDNNED